MTMTARLSCLLLFLGMFAAPVVAQGNSSNYGPLSPSNPTEHSQVFSDANPTTVTVTATAGITRVDVIDANGDVVAGSSQTLDADNNDVRQFVVPAGGRLAFKYYGHAPGGEGSYTW